MTIAPLGLPLASLNDKPLPMALCALFQLVSATTPALSELPISDPEPAKLMEMGFALICSRKNIWALVVNTVFGEAAGLVIHGPVTLVACKSVPCGQVNNRIGRASCRE